MSSDNQTTISHDQLRACGYSGMVGLRDDVAFRLLCAFNGADPDKAPPAWWAYPNSASKAAWERVAAEAAAIFGGA